MRLSLHVMLLVFCAITGVTYAQNDKPPSLNIGDPAPALRVSKWIKGVPIQRFEKDNVYILEFWATWCKPCIAAMPHLSDLAVEYKDRIKVLGIDVYEKATTSTKQIEAFVDSLGHRMEYTVATDDSNLMVTDWLFSSGDLRKGIPIAYVVNAEGRVAWIGHPTKLNEILPKIVNKTWDIKAALTKRKSEKYLEKLDNAASDAINRFTADPFKPGDPGKPDSALLIINEIVRKEPRLKYAPVIAYYTFMSLLKMAPEKAYEYGKVLFVTPTYEDPPFSTIIATIKLYSEKLKLPPHIYQLGAEAYQANIDYYPEVDDIPSIYYKMSAWYWRANNKLKAIEAGQQAIETLKHKRDYSATDLAAFEFQLKRYKNQQY